MAYTDVNSEDRLVQATFAEHLKNALGWESVDAGTTRPSGRKAHCVRRGAPDAGGQARAQHAPGAAECRLHRFHRNAPVQAPDAYTKPWTAVMPLRVIDGLLFEYACHEANYGMEGVLRGARFREREAAKK